MCAFQNKSINFIKIKRTSQLIIQIINTFIRLYGLIHRIFRKTTCILICFGLLVFLLWELYLV